MAHAQNLVLSRISSWKRCKKIKWSKNSWKNYENGDRSVLCTACDEAALSPGRVRANYGSYKSINSATIAQHSACFEIGHALRIESRQAQAAFKKRLIAEGVTSSRTWIVPRIILHLWTGSLVLKNIKFLCDYAPTEENLPMWYPIFFHTKPTSKLVLVANIAVVDEIDLNFSMRTSTSRCSMQSVDWLHAAEAKFITTEINVSATLTLKLRKVRSLSFSIPLIKRPLFWRYRLHFQDNRKCSYRWSPIGSPALAQKNVKGKILFFLELHTRLDALPISPGWKSHYLNMQNLSNLDSKIILTSKERFFHSLLENSSSLERRTLILHQDEALLQSWLENLLPFFSSQLICRHVVSNPFRSSSLCLKSRSSSQNSALASDVNSFVCSCLQCLSTAAGDKLPRPSGPAVYCSRVNYLQKFYYINIGLDNDGKKDIVIRRDDHSGYCWIYSYAPTTHINATNLILNVCAGFGAIIGLMFHVPTHFQNSTIGAVPKSLLDPRFFDAPLLPLSLNK